jgi:hypothetical protein
VLYPASTEEQEVRRTLPFLSQYFRTLVINRDIFQEILKIVMDCLSDFGWVIQCVENFFLEV